MNDMEGLLAACCADPEDNFVRLVFADWLEENDNAPYAHFMREHIKQATRPQNYADWAGERDVRKDARRLLRAQLNNTGTHKKLAAIFMSYYGRGGFDKIIISQKPTCKATIAFRDYHFDRMPIFEIDITRGLPCHLRCTAEMWLLYTLQKPYLPIMSHEVTALNMYLPFMKLQFTHRSAKHINEAHRWFVDCEIVNSEHLTRAWCATYDECMEIARNFVVDAVVARSRTSSATLFHQKRLNLISDAAVKFSLAECIFGIVGANELKAAVKTKWKQIQNPND